MGCAAFGGPCFAVTVTAFLGCHAAPQEGPERAGWLQCGGHAAVGSVSDTEDGGPHL